LFNEGSLRRHLLQARYLYIVLKDGQLTFEKMYIETDVAYLLFMLDLLNHLAETYERTIDLPVSPEDDKK
jgi:hypothetical protein